MSGSEPVGNLFLNSATTTGQILQIVAPGTNTAGLIIRTAILEITAPSSGLSSASLYVGTAAPSAPGDNSVRNILNMYAFAGFSSGYVLLPYPLSVRAGYGLWFASVTVGGVNVTYDLLS